MVIGVDGSPEVVQSAGRRIGETNALVFTVYLVREAHYILR